MFDHHFFKQANISPELMEHGALLALEIFAVVTGNFPAAFTVTAVHALLFAYEQYKHFKPVEAEALPVEHNGFSRH